ncbi:MAG: sodium:solute symporter [Verrucomicrobiota bacterium JB024]|nr:sodium:solute symporter [Verrucomicrobiota bacterium JB024]
MTLIDWIILIVFTSLLLVVTIFLKRYTRSVADFLSANRAAGRYLVTMAEGASGLGAINLIAYFEMYYLAGFVPAFWHLMLLPAGLIISTSGWVIYRYRQTRAMTLGQFFELRYGRKFRIFAGGLAFFSGIINYGIFPAVTARFFVYFCGLPEAFRVGEFDVQTYPVVMICLLSLALFFTLTGGQVVIMVTDFIQAQFVNVVLVVTLIFLVLHFNMDTVKSTLVSLSDSGHSRVNPFDAGEVKHFNAFFFFVNLFGAFYWTMAWQGGQAYNSSARSPHEARMGKILAQWRTAVTTLLPIFLPVAAFVVMHSTDFMPQSQAARDALGAVGDAQLQKQLTTPLVIRELLPAGMLGLFATVMLASAVSTDNTYMHSWGSILIQDVIVPLRGRPLSHRQHMLWLRVSILGVAVFAFFFSLLFRQTQYILLFMSLTGAIFLGGAGAAIIGGLYSRRGTTPAAFVAMIAGSVIGCGGILVKQLDPDFPFDGQQMLFAAMVISLSLYVIVSLTQRQAFNLDRMLHRGKYAKLTEHPEKYGQARPRLGWHVLKPGKDFNRRDKFIFYLTLAWSLTLFSAFAVISLMNLHKRWSDDWWFTYWEVFLGIGLVKAVIVTIWFLIGGGINLRELLEVLRHAKRNSLDDGSVSDGLNRDEVATAKAEKEL